ncbi:hypothetical protein WR25_18380 [Diploscapter pachys]|uniref:Uncharacterized protein n=1 Tax=Diploscapter pachys TaxID=2018661 RepID=A0A2A2JZF4_9BILA|nr:hypothetical protein WR25_18380 [Diploscapter pachys]
MQLARRFSAHSQEQLQNVRLSKLTLRIRLIYAENSSISAVCASALNSGGSTNICCSSSTSTTPPPSSIPQCPNNAIPQPSSAIYVPCLQNDPTTCETGFSCVQSSNVPSIFLCCTSGSVQFPTCPSNLSLYTVGNGVSSYFSVVVVLQENGRARYCLSAQSSSNCPLGYSCQLAVGTTSTFVCCSTSPSQSDCPANYTPVQGPAGPTTCSPLSPSACPSGSVCIQSIRSSTVFVCCIPSTTPRVCPNNGNALLTPSGNVQTCTSVGSACNTVCPSLFSSPLLS